MTIPAGAIESIRRYGKLEKRKFRVMLIVDAATAKKREGHTGPDILIEVDFNDPLKIAEGLAPYQDELYARTYRTESYMARFIQVIPHVPYLRTPTTESLRWASDKLEMRRRFRLLAGKFSPKYTVIKENTKSERRRIVEKIKFPLIVKPTNLAQSLLVTVCYHEEELERAIHAIRKKIQKIYDENGRSEAPKIIAEEFMEGDMYSVDAYVNSRGTLYFCPMVKVVTGHNIGHDDFFNYLHMSPTSLKPRSI